MDLVLFLVVIVGIVVMVVRAKELAKRENRERLLAKYGDPDVVDMIVRRMIWQDQTEEQLLDSLGNPLAIDQTVLKTKTKEVWKYHETGPNRYALRVKLENGYVIGWDKKG